jgi:hypothetical protein
MGRKKKCVSNSTTSSHNDSFVLLFMCMFISCIQLINDKHLKMFKWHSSVLIYVYVCLNVHIIACTHFQFDHFSFIRVNGKKPSLLIPSFLVFLYDVRTLVHRTF